MIAAERLTGSVYVADVVALALQADLVEVSPRCTLHGVRCMLASLVWQHTAELQLIKSHSAALRAAVTELVAQAAPMPPAVAVASAAETGTH